MTFTNKAFYPIALVLSVFITSCKTTNEANINTSEAFQNQSNNRAPLMEVKEIDKQNSASVINNYKYSKKIVPPEVNEAIKLAIAAKAAGEVDVAKQHLEQLAVTNPKLSIIQVYLGDIASSKGYTNLAEHYYKQAIAINTYNYFALNRLALLHRKAGQFDLAESNYRLALMSWPDFAPAHLNLGILLDLYLGDKSEALEHYEKYQVLTNSQSRQVNGWIADISRQLQLAKRDK